MQSTRQLFFTIYNAYTATELWAPSQLAHAEVTIGLTLASMLAVSLLYICIVALSLYKPAREQYNRSLRKPGDYLFFHFELKIAGYGPKNTYNKPSTTIYNCL